MQVFFFIAYAIVGIVQWFAIVDGIGHALNVGSFISFVIAGLITYIPLLGSALGVYGAINVWDWGALQACVLFFWYIPVFLIFAAFSALANR